MQLFEKLARAILLIACVAPITAGATNITAYRELKLSNPYSDTLLQVDLTVNIPGVGSTTESLIIPPDRSAIILQSKNSSMEFKAAVCANAGVGDVCVNSAREISVSAGQVIRGKVVMSADGELKACGGVGGSWPVLATVKGDAFLCLDSDQNLTLEFGGAVGTGAVAVGTYTIRIGKLPVGPRSKLIVSNFRITYPTSSTTSWNKEIRGTISGEWVNTGGALTGVVSSYFKVSDWRALANAGYKIKAFIETDKPYHQGDAVIQSDGSWSLNTCWPTKGTINTIYAELYDSNGKRIARSRQVRTDVSDNYFSLSEQGELVVSYPLNGTRWRLGSTHPIEWRSYKAGDYVAIHLYRNGNYYKTISARTPNDGSFSWTIPTYYDVSDRYKIKVMAITEEGLYDFSNGFFSLYR